MRIRMLLLGMVVLTAPTLIVHAAVDPAELDVVHQEARRPPLKCGTERPERNYHPELQVFAGIMAFEVVAVIALATWFVRKRKVKP